MLSLSLLLLLQLQYILNNLLLLKLVLRALQNIKVLKNQILVRSLPYEFKDLLEFPHLQTLLLLNNHFLPLNQHLLCHHKITKKQTKLIKIKRNNYKREMY